MLRRNARLRKEYLLKKSQEADKAEAIHHRQQIQDSLEHGKTIPSELRHDAENLKNQSQLDDPTLATATTHVDDEYNKVGEYEPRILMTSSHSPSARLLQFIKEFRLCIPNSQRMTRGNIHMKDLVEICRNNDFTDLLIVHEHRGEPNGLVLCHFPYGPTIHFTISHCVLRHDIDQDLGTVSEAYPHLIFHNFTSQLGARVSLALKALYPVPNKDSTHRIMSFVNREDRIFFRHHVYKRNPPFARDENGNKKEEIELAEVGPRFELKPFHIKLGTVDMPEAETEWVFKSHFSRDAKKNHL